MPILQVVLLYIIMNEFIYGFIHFCNDFVVGQSKICDYGQIMIY